MRPVMVSVESCHGGPDNDGCSQVIPVDRLLSPFYLTISCHVEGNAKYTVEHTFDDVFEPGFRASEANWFPAPTKMLCGTSKDGYHSYSSPFTAARLRVHNGSGTVFMRGVHGGVQPEYAQYVSRPRAAPQPEPTRWERVVSWFKGVWS